MSLFFFFSSRRRHTRFDCDWSSDVSSSDLADRDGQDEQYRSAIQPARCAHENRRPPSNEANRRVAAVRSEEHTSELQSQSNLVCRLLLEKKKSARCRPSSAFRLACSEFPMA